MELNPSAARSLEEGMEETLTVHRLRVPAQLRRTLASTNVIESAFSIVETVRGYREIPSLLTSLANTVSKKAVAEEMKVAQPMAVESR
jgi:transposase-like protein